MQLTIAWLYPDLLNLYGDRGNILCLKKRAEWRRVSVEVKEISIQTKLTNSLIRSINFLFMGGGPDNLQKLVYEDFLKSKGPFVKEYIEKGGVGLFICGAYQLLGYYYRPAEGADIPGLRVLDLYTQHFGKDKERCVGNIVVRSSYCSSERSESRTSTKGAADFSTLPHYVRSRSKGNSLVGFENHGGRTYLGKNLKPLGTVTKGFGNNGEDKTEGAVYKNTFGTYLHGPVLPKNPHFADYLLAKALKIPPEELKPLDDFLEWSAHSKAVKISKAKRFGSNSLLTEKLTGARFWLMDKLQSKPYLRAFSGLSINLSAAWFVAAFATPNFSSLRTSIEFMTLTIDAAFGILFLALTIKFEKSLQ